MVAIHECIPHDAAPCSVNFEALYLQCLKQKKKLKILPFNAHFKAPKGVQNRLFLFKHCKFGDKTPATIHQYMSFFRRPQERKHGPQNHAQKQTNLLNKLDVGRQSRILDTTQDWVVRKAFRSIAPFLPTNALQPEGPCEMFDAVLVFTMILFVVQVLALLLPLSKFCLYLRSIFVSIVTLSPCTCLMRNQLAIWMAV